MGTGHEYLRTLHEALARFERAIKNREHRLPLTGKVTLQQEADDARQHVVDTVVKLVTDARLGRESSGEPTAG
jgi:hypothetical protein